MKKQSKKHTNALTKFQKLICEYVEDEYHRKSTPLKSIVAFLLENAVSNPDILRAVHRVSPNFGNPELQKQIESTPPTRSK